MNSNLYNRSRGIRDVDVLFPTPIIPNPDNEYISDRFENYFERSQFGNTGEVWNYHSLYNLKKHSTTIITS